MWCDDCIAFKLRNYRFCRWRRPKRVSARERIPWSWEAKNWIPRGASLLLGSEIWQKVVRRWADAEIETTRSVRTHGGFWVLECLSGSVICHPVTVEIVACERYWDSKYGRFVQWFPKYGRLKFGSKGNSRFVYVAFTFVRQLVV